MELNKFKKLENKVKKPTFSEDYKGTNMILKGLSFLGNIASIFLASFFVSQLLSVAIENTYVVWIISIIFLCGLELTKRVIFYRFSRDFIRTNELFTSKVAPMLIFTMILISLSFYSSLSGAKKFSSKSDKLENVAETNIKVYQDSLRNIYSEDITFYNTEIKNLKEVNEKYRNKILETPLDYITARKEYQDLIDENNKQIETETENREQLESELENKIETHKKEVLSETSEDINKNKSDSYVFIATSTIIEFLILLGIYFNNIYNFRSYRDVKRKLLNDDNFKTYYKYNEILENLYLNREEKDLIPEKELLEKLLFMNKVYLNDGELDDAIDLFKALKILESSDKHTYIIKDKKEAVEAIKNHFNI